MVVIVTMILVLNKVIQDHYYHVLYQINVEMHVMEDVVQVVHVGHGFVVIVIVNLIVENMIIIVHVKVCLIFGVSIYFGLDANEM